MAKYCKLLDGRIMYLWSVNEADETDGLALIVNRINA
jgi:hypothetical protein